VWLTGSVPPATLSPVVVVGDAELLLLSQPDGTVGARMTVRRPGKCRWQESPGSWECRRDRPCKTARRCGIKKVLTIGRAAKGEPR